MAFTATTLSQLATGGGFTLWHYSTTDNIATMNTAAYFDGAVNLLGVRDIIIASDTSTPTTSFVSVLSNNGTTVDVSDGTAIAETDSD